LSNTFSNLLYKSAGTLTVFWIIGSFSFLSRFAKRLIHSTSFFLPLYHNILILFLILFLPSFHNKPQHPPKVPNQNKMASHIHSLFLSLLYISISVSLYCTPSP